MLGQQSCCWLDKILFCKEAARLMSIFNCEKETSPAPVSL